ncbi:hypothetical protein GCM10008179_30340 [Hansschlegelia plantiphila]|uniref:Uncharacterized protein n=1 Tax=Hansschlegelia plantiphila TaxID=374655 RepID=A0A9W6J418_9HYPH|nr:hypothetical protein GCM10008179_30340 [Hansschlegelia plantiphila]
MPWMAWSSGVVTTPVSADETPTSAGTVVLRAVRCTSTSLPNEEHADKTAAAARRAATRKPRVAAAPPPIRPMVPARSKLSKAL